MVRAAGTDGVIQTVEAYHKVFPAAKDGTWHPEAFAAMDTPEWGQLYVNAEHDGTVGIVTIGRESYNADVDAELNRALDWLEQQKIDRVLLTGDFHLSTQLVGADTSEFFPALGDVAAGTKVSGTWSRTARRLFDDFAVSVAFINGKRCLGGMLELMLHCDYVVAVDDASLGFPEVTLPVVPGMEGCHWPFRKARKDQWPKLLNLLLSGRPVRAADAVGWLIDHAGPLESAIGTAWAIATDDDHTVRRREIDEGKLEGVPVGVSALPPAGAPEHDAGRTAIMTCILASCGVTLSEALDVQTRHSAEFMVSDACRRGSVGQEYERVMKV